MQYSLINFPVRTAFSEQIQRAKIILDRRGSMSVIFKYPLQYQGFFSYNIASKLKRGLVYDYWYP